MAKIKVLLVEDVGTLSSIVKETLDDEGFGVRVAADGLEGLRAFVAFSPDVVIVDIMMPNMDGFEMVRQIRISDRLTPVLFLTSRSAVEDVVRGFDVGADDYVRKPFSMIELIARIKALVTRAGLRARFTPDNLIRIGRFSLDTVTQVLSGPSGTGEELSNREMEILRMLVERRNEVVESKEILMRLWGDDSPYNLRSLWVFITKLRQRLAADPGIRIINARGHGYKLMVKDQDS